MDKASAICHKCTVNDKNKVGKHLNYDDQPLKWFNGNY